MSLKYGMLVLEAAKGHWDGLKSSSYLQGRTQEFSKRGFWLRKQTEVDNFTTFLQNLIAIIDLNRSECYHVIAPW